MTHRIVDLSLLIEEGMQTFCAYWHPVVEITQLGRHGIENRETRKVVLGTHTGTHVDAPRHFIKSGATIENVQLDRLVGPAAVLDFSGAKRFQQLEIADVKSALGARSPVRLIARFDWDSEFGKSHYYTDHAFFSEEACHWLVRQGCQLLAMDTPQPDNPLHGRTGPKDAPNHKILLGSDVILVEYLTHLRELRQPDVFLVVAPIKIKDGDGAPARCFAIEGNPFGS